MVVRTSPGSRKSLFCCMRGLPRKKGEGFHSDSEVEEDHCPSRNWVSPAEALRTMPDGHLWDEKDADGRSCPNAPQMHNHCPDLDALSRASSPEKMEFLDWTTPFVSV